MTGNRWESVGFALAALVCTFIGAIIGNIIGHWLYMTITKELP